jgi:hypothetical protein
MSIVAFLLLWKLNIESAMDYFFNTRTLQKTVHGLIHDFRRDCYRNGFKKSTSLYSDFEIVGFFDGSVDIRGRQYVTSVQLRYDVTR